MDVGAYIHFVNLPWFRRVSCSFRRDRPKKNGMLSPALATTPVASIVPRGKRLGPTPTCPPTRSSIAVAFYRTHASAIRATMGRPPLRLLECIFRMRGRRGDRGRRWHVGARARGSGFRSGGPSRRVARACPPGPLATHGYDRVFDWRGRGAAGGGGQLADHELLEAAAARLEMLIVCKDSRSAIKSKGVPACVQLLTSHELKVVRLHASHVLAVQVDDSDRKERRRSLANQGLFNYKGTHGVCKDTNSRRYPPQCCRLRLGVHRDAVFGGRCCTCTAASESVTMPLLPLCAWHCVAALRRCRPVAAARSPLSLPPLAI